MATVVTSGTVTTTIGTATTSEISLATVTGAAVLQMIWDGTNMANATSGPDIVEARIYGKPVSATDNTRLLYIGSWQGPQNPPMLASLAVVSPHYSLFTIKHIAGTGTGTDFKWAIYSTT